MDLKFFVILRNIKLLRKTSYTHTINNIIVCIDRMKKKNENKMQYLPIFFFLYYILV